MRVKLWGVRGSLPTPLTPEQIRARLEEVLRQYEGFRESGIKITAEKFLETLPVHLTGGYGGNTSCGEVTVGRNRLIIDGGSGIRGLGELVMKTEPNVTEHHIYFTHFHWDHVIGLPFFSPFYIPGRTVHLYAVHEDLENNIRRIFRKPNFPVPFEAIEKQIRFHRVMPRQPFKIGAMTATPYELDHPDPTWGLRVEAGGRSLAWAVDTECTRTSVEEMGDDRALYTNADLCVFDAQYTFGQALERISWGHASGPIGIDVALRENVKRILFVHHDPAASDDVIRRAEEQTIHYHEQILRNRTREGMTSPELTWRFAHEGEAIEL